MTRPPLTAAAAQRRLLLLSTTRWFPIGLTIGITVLLMLERGLTLSQIGFVFAAQGFVVLALELPTGGLADAVGRRPVLVVAGVISVVSTVLFLSSTTFWAIALAWALQGVFRALDSGPLEAWYVDTAQADDPAVPVEQALSRAATLVGLGIALGALASGGLVAWAPLPGVSPLVLSYLLAVGCLVGHLVLTTILVREVRPPADGSRRRRLGRSLRQVPGTVRDGVRLLGTAPVLRALVLVEVFWSVGMIGFETLMPIRVAELVGGTRRPGRRVPGGVHAARRRGTDAQHPAAPPGHSRAAGHRAVDELDGCRRLLQPRAARSGPAGRADLDRHGDRGRRRLQHPRCRALPPRPPPGTQCPSTCRSDCYDCSAIS